MCDSYFSWLIDLQQVIAVERDVLTAHFGLKLAKEALSSVFLNPKWECLCANSLGNSILI